MRLARHLQAIKSIASSKLESTFNALTLGKHSLQSKGKKGKRPHTQCLEQRGQAKIQQIKNMRRVNSRVQSSNLAFRKEFMMKNGQRGRKGYKAQEVSSWELEAAAR